ncbi:MAG: hypothetical protein QM492_07690 [Rhodobacterales bacterium]
MLDFLYKKNALTLKLIPLLIVEVTAYVGFISIIYSLLRNDPISITILVVALTVPVLCFFFLSTLRTGLLELNISKDMDTERLVPVIFKMTLFFGLLIIVALALTLIIWYPIISYLDPGFQISALFSASLNDIMHHGLGFTKIDEDQLETQLVFGTLLPILFAIFFILHTLFTIPITSLAASMDGKSNFDPIRGIGLYFWSSLLTLSVGYILLVVYYIDIVLGTSLIFGISLTPEMIVNGDIFVVKLAAAFFLIILPISYLAAMHSAVSAKAYKRYINKMIEHKIAFIGARARPAADSRTGAAASLNTLDIASLRKMRERRTH